MVRKITKDPEQRETRLTGQYYDEEAGEFRDETLVVVHCEDEDEARDVAEAVATEVGIDE